jgi:PadR family transcriptional regulator PadR
VTAKERRPGGWTGWSTLCKNLDVSGEQVSSVRVTVAVAQILRAFLADVSQPRYGYDLMKATEFPSGKLYPILARLTAARWLVREDEDIDPAQEGRPRRSTYRLTEQGMATARNELALMSQQIALPPAQPWRQQVQPEGGPR